MSNEKKYQYILVAGHYEYDDNRHSRTEGIGDIVKVYTNPDKAGKAALERNARWLREDVNNFSDYYGSYYGEDENDIVKTVRDFWERHKEILAVYAEIEYPDGAGDVHELNDFVWKLVKRIDGEVMMDFIQSLPHFMYSVQQVEVED